MADKKTKKVPLGKPLPVNDKVLDVLSVVTEADIEKAKALWRSKAPKGFKDLLDAQTIEDEEV